MCEIFLEQPTIAHKQAVLDFLAECKHFESVLNGTGSLEKAESYEAWLQKIKLYSNKDTVPPDRVPATQFFAIRKSDNKIVGMLNLRHYLNDALAVDGGHIGDMVRPTERNKGYATQQIKLAIEECKKLGINKILITCLKDNIASKRTIEKNNGVFENEVKTDKGVVLRYWIDC